MVTGRAGAGAVAAGRNSPPLAPNIAGALAYGAGLITGIALLVVEPYKRQRYVRFHAWQSIWFSLAWIAIWIPWSIVASRLAGAPGGTPGRATAGGFVLPALLIAAMNRLLWLAGFLFWAFLLFKAYGGEQFQIPLIGKLAAGQAARPVG